MTGETSFILVRHGRTEWNREDRIRGRIDVPLDDTGRLQAASLAAALRGDRIDAAYSSPLSRAMDTAAAALLGMPVKAEPFDPIIDFDFGDWQGKLRTEIRQVWPELYSVYESDPARFTAPGGEALSACRDRALAGLETLASRHRGQTVLLSSHAVVCQLSLVALLGLGADRYWNVKQGNCAINRFSHGSRGWVIESINDTCHLKT